jgi:hypothetical protein
MSSGRYSILNLSSRQALLLVLAVAVLLRLPSVLWSKGFMASDDQYETVDVAYRWIQDGPLNEDGRLKWGDHPSEEISRFPLYTLVLYGIMKLYHLSGVTSLDTMMYGVRAAHALLSLLTVWGLFVIVRATTKSSGWAIIAGLVGAAHFALPYLSVRALIEVVCGEFWLIALVCLYCWEDRRRTEYLFIAGVLTGLAWMIRFQIAAAVLPIPLLLWWRECSLRPALIYVAGGAAMVLVAGIVDSLLLGKFLGSFINHVAQGFSEGSLYQTPRFVYPLTLLAVAVPPFSIAALVWAWNRTFRAKHLLLSASIICFVVLHTLAANRQERFMLPILPAVLLVLVLSTADRFSRADQSAVKTRAFRWLIAPSILINVALLVILTGNYSHKGLVEPLVEIEEQKQNAHVVFVTPEKQRIFPLTYGGIQPVQRNYLYAWEDFPKTAQALTEEDTLEFFITYSPEVTDLPRYRDSLEKYFGSMNVWRTVEPSMLDAILHTLNPKHNRTNRAIILCPNSK